MADVYGSPGQEPGDDELREEQSDAAWRPARAPYSSRERIACDRKSISETATTITTAMAETWA
jgi:hypothetical protein